MNEEPIRITAEDLELVPDQPGTVLPLAAPRPLPDGERSYGTIVEAAGLAPSASGSPAPARITRQAWFYLGLAGALGALVGWAVVEPFFVDGTRGFHFADLIMLPVMIASMVLAFALSESFAEQNMQKAVQRSLLSLPLGAVLGLVFNIGADIAFNLLLNIDRMLGVQSIHNPLFWLARAIAWCLFGAVGGIVYGIIGQSYKKGKYGIFGGMIGAFLGGFCFDPIVLLLGGHVQSAWLSRALGFSLLGLATGICIGLVENALKDRWFYVTEGPLAGKQFILYKANTTIGSDPRADIYLFKDADIAPAHCSLEVSGARVRLLASAPVFVSGVPVRQRALVSGDLVQIGRYCFRYQEKLRA